MSLSLQWAYEGDVHPEGKGLCGNANLAAWLILAGEAEVKLIQGKAGQCRAGEWLFLPAGVRMQTFAKHTQILSVCWRAKWPDGRNFFDRGLPLQLKADAEPELESSARELMTFQNEHLKLTSKTFPLSRGLSPISALTYLQGESLLVHWMIHVTRALADAGVHPQAHETPDERVLLALELLETLPLANKPGISYVAWESGLSVSQLERLFAQHVGHSPRTHLQRRKISEARALLANEEFTLKEIAYRLGFSSQNVFYNWFHKHHGIGPKAYRVKYGK